MLSQWTQQSFDNIYLFISHNNNFWELQNPSKLGHPHKSLFRDLWRTWYSMLDDSHFLSNSFEIGKLLRLRTFYSEAGKLSCGQRHERFSLGQEWGTIKEVSEKAAEGLSASHVYSNVSVLRHSDWHDKITWVFFLSKLLDHLAIFVFILYFDSITTN